MSIQEKHSVPSGYEKIEHHDYLSLHNEEKGIIIMVMELRAFQDGWEKFDYRVSGSQNQETIYQGAFQSLSHAEDKVYEVARDH